MKTSFLNLVYAVTAITLMFVIDYLWFKYHWTFSKLATKRL